MRAFVITEYAHPSKIPLTQNAPEPIPGKDQVLVNVYSAGVNFFDVRASMLRFTGDQTQHYVYRFSKLKGNIKLSLRSHS